MFLIRTALRPGIITLSKSVSATKTEPSEIVVTPEMIEAGAKEMIGSCFYSGSMDFDKLEILDIFTRVFSLSGSVHLKFPE